MPETIRRLGSACFASLLTAAGPAMAADYGAVTSGNWSNATTWTGGTAVPGASDTAYIGSTYPTGAAATVTVTLTQNQSANTVYLGFGASTNGTLNLGNFQFTASNLYLGYNNSIGAITRGTGTLTATHTYLYNGTSLALSGGDALTYLELYGGSTATTAATGNITQNVTVGSGGTGSLLTLGAPLSVTGNVDIRGGTLNAQNNPITANNQMLIGWFGGPAALTNRGKITARELYVADQSLNLTATDAVQHFYLSAGSTSTPAGTALPTGAAVMSLQLLGRATATTSASGNITQGVLVGDNVSHALLTLGAPLSVTGNVDIRGGTLNAQNNPITANNQMLIGWFGGPAALTNRGKITARELYVADQSLNLTATDAVQHFYLSAGSAPASTALPSGAAVMTLNLLTGASAATSAVSNITQGVSVGREGTGSLLTLGAPLSVTGSVDIRAGAVNAQTNAITANTVYLGWYGGPAILSNRGAVTAANLYVANQNFNLTATDVVQNFFLSAASSAAGTTFPVGAAIRTLDLGSGATATTSAAGNITQGVTVGSVGIGSILTLGAQLNVSGNVDVRIGTLNAQCYPITAANVFLGTNGGGAATVQNLGTLTTSQLSVGNGTQVTLCQGSSTVGTLNLSNNSVLTVPTLSGQLGQLTVTNSASSALTIDATSKLRFDLNGLVQGNVLRWANPTGGNHVSDLNSLIAAGRIEFTYANGSTYQFTTDADYTYIFQPVPEPATVFGIGAGVLGIGAFIRRRWRGRRGNEDEAERVK